MKGAAQPGFFVDLSSEQIEEGIKVNYLTAAYTAHVICVVNCDIF